MKDTRHDVHFATLPTDEIGNELVISENVWGTTTGKHLNWINEDKTKRIPNKEFEQKLSKILTKFDLNL